MRLHEPAAIRVGAKPTRQLNRRDHHFVSLADRFGAELVPLRQCIELSRIFAGQLDPRFLAKLEVAQRFEEIRIAHPLAEHRHADVRGFHQHIPHGQLPIGIHVCDMSPVGSEVMRAVNRKNFRGFCDAPRERRAGDKRLDRRAGFIRIGHNAIAARLRLRILDVLRVECRPIRQRQHFAGLGIDHDDFAAIGSI